LASQDYVDTEVKKIDTTSYLLKTEAVGTKVKDGGEKFNSSKEASGSNSHAEG
jgi:hypothetical protein